MTSPRDAHVGDLLVVDDNRVNRLLLGRALEQLGHRVTFAENGRQALEALGRRRADLVLLQGRCDPLRQVRDLRGAARGVPGGGSAGPDGIRGDAAAAGQTRSE